ncbi:hypothetical protein DEEACLCL_00084 [Salmonella phage CRW-SP2]|nr:hypothetical protein DEEACLCL_00084 [Salmonella phage CRW-SP2]
MKTKKTQTPPEPVIEVAKDERILPSYLRRIIDNKPVGGDDGSVYAGDYGWVCEYPDGTKELLEEYTGLAAALRNYGLNKYGQPIPAGTVVHTNITVETLNLLSTEDLGVLGAPLGIEGDRETLIAGLIEKLQIK